MSRAALATRHGGRRARRRRRCPSPPAARRPGRPYRGCRLFKLKVALETAGSLLMLRSGRVESTLPRCATHPCSHQSTFASRYFTYRNIPSSLSNDIRVSTAVKLRSRDAISRSKQRNIQETQSRSLKINQYAQACSTTRLNSRVERALWRDTPRCGVFPLAR